MRTNSISLLLASSALSVAWPSLASAEAADAQPEVEAAAATPAIVVTGSRIIRDGYTAPTPVTVASAVDLLRSTPSSIPDALNKLPQFSNSLSPSRAASNFSNLPIHGNILNLRGLGTTGANPKGPLRTLILFDGTRVAPTNYLGTIDTNVLPQLLMQRVDVVTGGASAAWGSDAVAGVVNFVLDKKFTGLTGVAQGGVAERGYASNQRIALAGGFNFGSDRGHVLISAEYNHNSGMKRADRDFSNIGYNFVGSGSGALGSTSNPYVIVPDVKISAIAPNGRITGSNVAGNPLVGQVINSDGTTRAFNAGSAVGSPGLQRGGDGYAITQQNAALIPNTNYQGFARIAYDVNDDINVYAQVSGTRSDYSYPTQTNALVGPSQAVNIFSGNPYLSAAQQTTLPNATDFITVQQYDAGQPQPYAKERTSYWLATAGINGKKGPVKWSLSYSHGSSKHDMSTSGLYDSRKLYAAVDVVNLGGVNTCRVLTDPTLAAAFAGCKPLDVLHGDPSKSTPAGYVYATGTSRYTAWFKQDAVTLNLSGSPLELPAGPVDVAVGAEYRHQSLKLASNADPLNLLTDAQKEVYFAGLRGVPRSAATVLDPNGTPLPSFFWLTNVGSANGSLSVKEGFAEVAVPLLKGVTGFQELNVNGALRVTDYSSSGTVTTWKVGGSWRPVSDLLLRGTYSRDIRAPNLFELYSGPQPAIGIVNDPQVNGIGSGLNQNVISAVVGNAALKPEKAKTLTFGGVLSPSFLPGFSISIDYYRINLDNAIDQLSSQQIVNNCTNSGGTAPDCANIVRATPTSLPTLINIKPTNLAFLKTSGVDFDLSYRTKVGKTGNLGVRLFANYLSKFDVQQFVGGPVLHYAGVSVVTSNPAAFPHLRGNLTVDYENDRFGVTISEQMIGHMRLDIPGNLPNGAQVQFVKPNVGKVFYTDLTLRAKVNVGAGRMVEPFLTINNLFDRDPPIIPGTTPGVNLPTNISIYDILGRAYTAGVRFKF